MSNKFPDSYKKEICNSIDTSSINVDELGYFYISNDNTEYKIGISINYPSRFDYDIFHPNLRFIKIYHTRYYKELEKTIINVRNYKNYDHNTWSNMTNDMLIDIVEHLYNFYENLPDEEPIR